VPSAETAQAVYDALDFTRALNVYNNSFRGASAYALRQGFHSVGAEDNNSVLIFSELMEASSLFLTGNADTIYYMATLDLTNGPMVIEQPTGAQRWPDERRGSGSARQAVSRRLQGRAAAHDRLRPSLGGARPQTGGGRSRRLRTAA
jgi:Protein of unknown function (DUF1254)